MEKTVIITGAATGIGLELAKYFAANNYKLFLIDKDEIPKIENAHAEYYQQDTTNFTQTEKCLEDILKKTDTIDVLVNNAGISIPGFLNLSVEDELDQYWVNKYLAKNPELSSQQLASSHIDGLSYILNKAFPNVHVATGSDGKSEHICTIANVKEFEPEKVLANLTALFGKFDKKTVQIESVNLETLRMKSRIQNDLTLLKDRMKVKKDLTLLKDGMDRMMKSKSMADIADQKPRTDEDASGYSTSSTSTNPTPLSSPKKAPKQ